MVGPITNNFYTIDHRLCGPQRGKCHTFPKDLLFQSDRGKLGKKWFNNGYNGVESISEKTLIHFNFGYLYF